MNFDLNIRLLSGIESRRDRVQDFFELLTDELTAICNKKDVRSRPIVITRCCINSDEDDTAYIVDEGIHFHIVID